MSKAVESLTPEDKAALQTAIGLDEKLDKAGGAISGSLDMLQNDVGNLPPTEDVPPFSAARKKYVDDKVTALAQAADDGLEAKLDKAGGAVSGALDMLQNDVGNLPPTEDVPPFSAARKKYVDDKVTALAQAADDGLEAKLDKAGGSVSGAIDMLQNDIGNLPPTENVPPFSAARRKYVDDKVAALTEAWSEADKTILWPTPVAFISGRLNTLYGRQMVRKRARQSQLDVHLVCSAEAQAAAGLSAFLAPQFRFYSDELVNAQCRIEVKDPTAPTMIWKKDFTAYIVNAVQVGEVLVCQFGDSTAALRWGSLKAILLATGATVSGVGTLPLNDGAHKYEGRAGWSAMDYMGRTRPVTATNPFLRPLLVSVPGELAIIQANATKCFADDAAFGTGIRPSYAQDSSRQSYSLFSWEHWRQAVTPALNSDARLSVVMQLGRNGATVADWIADNELAQRHMAKDFVTTFPNGQMVVSSEAIADGTDVANGIDQATGYPTFTAPLIAKKIAWFSGREAERIWLAPAWAMMDAYGGFYLGDAVSVDPDTGTERCALYDGVHYRGQPRAQDASAVAPPILLHHQRA